MLGKITGKETRSVSRDVRKRLNTPSELHTWQATVMEMEDVQSKIEQLRETLRQKEDTQLLAEFKMGELAKFYQSYNQLITIFDIPQSETFET